MPDLFFQIREIVAVPYAAVPTMAARLCIQNKGCEQVHSISLNCQVLIEPLGRNYSAEEEMRLLDLFGERERWTRTMRPMLWSSSVIKVPAFTGEIELDVPLPCTLDFDVAATKYFYGLRQGIVKGSVLFSGTVFYADATGSLQVAQIPWDREAGFRLPFEIWQQAIDLHYPNSAWLRLSRETFDRLYRYRVSHGTPNWDRVLEDLLDHAEVLAKFVRDDGLHFLPAVRSGKL
jgi:hypothetical protein